MRIGHIELTFDIEPRETARELLSKKPASFTANAECREALCRIGRFSALLTW